MQDALPGTSSLPSAAHLGDAEIVDALFDAAETPKYIVDTGLHLVRFNRATAQEATRRWRRDLHPGMTIEDLMPSGEERDAVVGSLRQALAGSPALRSGWSDRADGRRYLREDTYLPVRGVEGGVIGVAMVSRDRTPDRSRCVEASRPETEETLFQKAPVGMAVVQLDGKILATNPMFAQIVGSTAEQLVGRSVLDITWPEDRGVSPLAALSRGSIQRYEVEKRYRRGDGRAIWVHVTATRLPGDPPRLLGVVVPIEEIAPQTVADRESLARGRAIFESQPEGVALITRGGVVLEANRAFARMQGRTREQVLGQSIGEFEVGRTPAEFNECLNEAVRIPMRLESVHRRVDGSTYPVEIATAPLTYGGQALICCTVEDLTKRRALEAQAQTSNERYRRLVESSPNITYSFSDVRGGLYYSPQVEVVLGYTPAELLARAYRWFDSIHPDDLPIAEQALATMESKGGFDVELRMRHKDGSWRWIREWSVSVERVGDELIVVGQAVDLTPLKDQEARFKRLVESAPDILYRWLPLPVPHFEYISPAVTGILGYTPEELLADGALLMGRIHEDDRALVAASTGIGSATDRPLRIRLHHRDGRIVWLELQRAILRDEAGHPVAMEGLARDVTSGVLAHQRLTMLGDALEQAAEVAIVTDRKGTILQVNTAFEHVTGHTREEAVGQNPRLLKSGRQNAEFYRAMWRTLNAGQVWRGSVVNRKKDGTHYNADVVITPVKDANGEIVNFIGLQRDTTRERSLDEALRQSQKMEAVGQVTGGVAHDFNNLLTVILANTNLVQDELPADAEARGWLQEIVSAVQHGSGMVRQLLAFGRHETLDPRPIRLADEIATFIPVLRRILRENIELAFIGGDTAWALVDRTAFEQVLLNLVTNARDAMPNGGRIGLRVGKRTIAPEEAMERPGVLVAGDFATLGVDDSGTGMDAATLKRVFEPFFTTKEIGKGTGLGLAMVYGLMQQHHGWVSIESTPGQGTRVTLGFPVTSAPAAVAPIGPPPPKEAAGRGEVVLLVEDEDSLRRVAARTLEREGYEVLTASDGEAGWDEWNRHGDRIALIISDAMMPKLDGPGLFRRLRASGCTVPVILTSGYSAEDLNDRAFTGVPVIPKPWSGETLTRKVREVLDAAVAGRG